MDKYLRPSRFDADINTPNVEKQWNHWLRTFTNFVGNLTFAGDAAAQQTAKLQTLTNYISAEVFEYIADANDLRQCNQYSEGVVCQAQEYCIQQTQISN